MVSLFIVAGIAATNPPEEPKYKNLKILPKNITKADLDKVMDGFKEALGVAVVEGDIVARVRQDGGAKDGDGTVVAL